MDEIGIGDACAAIRCSTVGDIVRAGGATLAGKPLPPTIEWTVEQADLVIGRARELRWVDDDPDELKLHVCSAGGRRFRLAAQRAAGEA